MIPLTVRFLLLFFVWKSLPYCSVLSYTPLFLVQLETAVRVICYRTQWEFKEILFDSIPLPDNEKLSVKNYFFCLIPNCARLRT